jgi:hypothetical protein
LEGGWGGMKNEVFTDWAEEFELDFVCTECSICSFLIPESDMKR